MANTNKQTYSVVIPAAGIGARFQALTPKQYTQLDGKPILQHTIEFFLDLPFIDRVIVALNSQDTYWATLPFTENGRVVPIEGGDTRAHSVLNGLTKLSTFEPADHWVLVHDACRPFVTREEVERLITTVDHQEMGGLLAIPSTDTLKHVVDGQATKTVSRDTIWRALTPQLFRLGLLRDAIAKALTNNQIITDESSAVEYLGLKPIVVEGSIHNRKITYKEDLLSNQFV